MGETVAMIAQSAPCNRLQEIVTRHPPPLPFALRPRSDHDSLSLPCCCNVSKKQTRLQSDLPILQTSLIGLRPAKAKPAVPGIGKLYQRLQSHRPFAGRHGMPACPSRMHIFAPCFAPDPPVQYPSRQLDPHTRQWLTNCNSLSPAVKYLSTVAILGR
jgi:hypothetical protein